MSAAGGLSRVCTKDEEGSSAESWHRAQFSPSRWTAVLMYCFLLFLFSPFICSLFSPLLPALLLLSLHSPHRLWPLWQPTDERSWVYSPLHYSAQLHSVSDEESDTVSVRDTCAGCPVGRGQSLWLCPLSMGALAWLQRSPAVTRVSSVAADEISCAGKAGVVAWSGWCGAVRALGS